MQSAGELIWASCRPLIRLVICVSTGFIITKTDNFPPLAARGAGQIMLNVALPCLMFSKIVPSFVSDNINALGPLVLVAILYEVIGIIMAWTVKQFFWVPHRFRYGILVAGGFGNVADIPTSVIVSVTGAAPFNGTPDQNLSVAYISVFIFIFVFTLFPCGAHHWIAKDYVGPEVEPEEVKEEVKRRRRLIMYSLPTAISNIRNRVASDGAMQTDDEEKSMGQSPICSDQHIPRDKQFGNEESGIQANVETTVDENRKSSMGSKPTATGKHVSFMDDMTTLAANSDLRSPVCSPTPTEVGFDPERVVSPEPTVIGDATRSFSQAQSSDALHPTGSASPPESVQLRPIASSAERHGQATPYSFHLAIRLARSFFTSFLTPASLAVLLSFPIALIPPLKGLFVQLPPSTSTSKFANPHIHPAPDGQPPLAILFDTASFLGAASVPLGLICLGSALARLSVPRNQWSNLPIGAIGMLSVCRMIILPVLGVGIVKGLVQGGLISKEDKVLQFVCIFFACVPTATTQVFLTQVFSGTGSAEHLSAFLIPQYILLFVSMTGLTAYALNSLF